jgi:hypothetical protein
LLDWLFLHCAEHATVVVPLREVVVAEVEAPRRDHRPAVAAACKPEVVEVRKQDSRSQRAGSRN